MKKKIRKLKKVLSLPPIGAEVIYKDIFDEMKKAIVVAHSNEFRYPLDNTILIKFEDGKEKWVKFNQLIIN